MKNKNYILKFEEQKTFRCSECGLEVVADDYNSHSGKCIFCAYKDTAKHFMKQRQKVFAEWLEATTKEKYIKLKGGI